MAITTYAAQTLANIRAKTRTSIHGRQLGLDRDFLGGVKEVRKVVTIVTTAGTVLPNHGFVALNSTKGPLSVTLQAPEPGVGVKIINISTEATAGFIITTVSGVIESSIGTTDTKVTFLNHGGAIDMIGITTGTWGVMDVSSTRVIVS